MEEKSLEQRIREQKVIRELAVYQEKIRLQQQVAEQTYPPTLVKALGDHFTYALMLKTGQIISFVEAEFISTSWVRLRQPQFHADMGELHLCSSFETAEFERGLEVRVSEIVWCVDAPNGS